MVHQVMERRGLAAALALVLIAAGATLLLATYGGAKPEASTGGDSTSPPPLPEQLLGNAPRSLVVVSPAFREGGAIPPRYTCDGEDVNPALEWSGVPSGARSLLLLVYDPDAPNGFFIHWVIYNIDPGFRGLPEAVEKVPATRYGAQALNDFGRIGYGGPCPPGGVHRYVFLVLALNRELSVPPGSPARRVLEAARGSVVAYGYTWGTYSRQRQ